MWFLLTLWNLHHLLRPSLITHNLGADVEGISCVLMASVQGCEILRRPSISLEGHLVFDMQVIVDSTLLLLRIMIVICPLFATPSFFLSVSIIVLYVTFSVGHYLLHGSPMSLNERFIKMCNPQSDLEGSYTHLLVRVDDLVSHLIEPSEILLKGF